MRRVVVTGIGIVSSIGNNAQEVVASLHDARSGIVAAEDYIRQNPTKCVLGALGLGVLIGLIVRR